MALYSFVELCLSFEKTPALNWPGKQRPLTVIPRCHSVSSNPNSEIKISGCPLRLLVITQRAGLKSQVMPECSRIWVLKLCRYWQYWLFQTFCFQRLLTISIVSAHVSSKVITVILQDRLFSTEIKLAEGNKHMLIYKGRKLFNKVCNSWPFIGPSVTQKVKAVKQQHRAHTQRILLILQHLHLHWDHIPPISIKGVSWIRICFLTEAFLKWKGPMLTFNMAALLLPLCWCLIGLWVALKAITKTLPLH